MFSKPLRETRSVKKNILKAQLEDASNAYLLTSVDFYKNNTDLKKYKMPELKTIVKQYNLLRTGTKNVLIERIEHYFTQTKSATLIQKVFRGRLVRYSFLLRGDVYKNKSICVNESDFITLEPLHEIPYELFYSYKDGKNFVYGFNLASLSNLINQHGKIINPYNREKLSTKLINSIITVNNITRIVYPAYQDELFPIPIIQSKKGPQNILNIQQNQPIALAIFENTDDTPPGFNQEYLRPRLFNPTTLTSGDLQKYNQIIDMRKKPTLARIQEVFMEIDQLGNYTQSNWFTDLDISGYIRFFRCLHDIWTYRANLSDDTKRNICPLFDPFANILVRSVYYNNIPRETIQTLCITIVENLIYSGTDDEYRKIATLHVLSALTVVSLPARHSMIWLYESISY